MERTQASSCSDRCTAPGGQWGLPPGIVTLEETPAVASPEPREVTNPVTASCFPASPIVNSSHLASSSFLCISDRLSVCLSCLGTWVGLQNDVLECNLESHIPCRASCLPPWGNPLFTLPWFAGDKLGKY